MKKFFLIILSSFVLFTYIAPVFSSAASAPFVVKSSFTHDYVYQYDCDASCVAAYDADHCFAYFYNIREEFSSYTFIRAGTVSDGYGVGIYFTGVPSYVHLTCVAVNLLSGATTTFIKIGFPNSSGNIYFTPFNPFVSTRTLYVFSPSGGSSFNSPLSSVDDFVNYYFVPSVTIRTPISKPVFDGFHSYFATDQYFYSICSDIGNYLDQNTIAGEDFIFNNMAPSVSKVDYNHVQLTFYNLTEMAVHYFVNCFDITTGNLVSSNKVTLSSSTYSSNYPIAVNHYTSGIWFAGFRESSQLEGFPLLTISWSDTPAYGADLIAIESLLNQIYTVNYEIETDLDSLKLALDDLIGRVDSVISILNSYFSWFKSSYFNMITGKWDLTNTKLDSIISILQGSSDQTTLPHRDDVQEGVSGYIEQESGIMNSFDSAGSDVDNVFNDIESRFDDLSSSFYGVSSLFELFVLENNLVLPLFLFSLAFGLIMLIIGRKAS